jgi:hypothetical protein
MELQFESHLMVHLYTLERRAKVEEIKNKEIKSPFFCWIIDE